MATSKGRGGAASKATAGKKSSAPSKGNTRTTGAGSPASKGASKAAASARGASSRNAGAGTKAVPKGVASKSVAKKATASKAAGAKGTALKSAGSKAAASKGTALKSAASKAPALKKSAASKAPASKKSPASKGLASKKAPAKKVAIPSKAVKATAARGNAVKSASAKGGSAARNASSARNASAKASSARAKKSAVSSGDPRNDLEKILQDLMKDIYYAEKKLVKALSKMAKNATNPKLKEAFMTHQSQTEVQITQLEKAFGLLGVPPKAKKCAAMDGLLEESNEHIEEYAKGAGLDAAMIVGAQKVEHYEIASYGSMRSFAKTLGYADVAMIFEKIREQESDTDELLTSLAESVINPKAEVETKDVSESAKSAAVESKVGSADSKVGSEDSEAGEDSSSSYSGREGGNGSMVDDEEVAISSLTDGNNREGDSETGEAMGY